MDNDTTHLTGVFSGTVTHLAPEALQAGRQSLAADVYAFGILLFELLTAESAWRGKTAPWIADAVANKRQRPVLGPSVPKDIVKLVSWCTEHNPADRPSIEQVTDTLAELMIAHSAEVASMRPQSTYTPPMHRGLPLPASLQSGPLSVLRCCGDSKGARAGLASSSCYSSCP